jgi:hypothetical protein
MDVLRSLRFSVVLACAFTALALACPAQAQEQWATYKNPRFGTTADYPAHLFTQREPPPENGDGQTFRTGDGRAQLSIYGARNVEGDTPQSYLDRYVDLEGAAIGLKRVTARFYVVSGTRGEEIFYDRCNFPAKRDGIIDCFTIAYPAADKAVWDAVVTRLSRSLRSGRGIEPRR